jgi:integrase
MSGDGDTLDQIRRLLGAGSGPSGPSFVQLWQRYYRVEGRKNDTAVDIERRGRLLCAFMGDARALEFTVERAEDYRDIRRDPDRCRALYLAAGVAYAKTKPRPATLNRELAVGRRALQWACEQRPQLLPYNPLGAFKAEDEDNVVTDMIRSEAELQRLLAAADATERAAVLLYIDCGPRRMEALSLLWTQLFMLKTAKGERPIIKLWKTKTDKPRTIGLTWRTFEALSQLPRISRYVFPGREPGRYKGKDAPVRPGAHLDPDGFNRRFKRLCKRAGVVGADGKPLTLHRLRHSFAFLRRTQDKISEKAIMGQGGWITRSAFDRYGIGDEDERADMYDQVNAGIKAALAALKPERK